MYKLPISLAPSRFQRLHDAILDLNPVAYYPLNELNNGLALDHANHKFTAQAVTSITRSGTTATVTTTAAHGYSTGDLIYISGAVETNYNGSFVITVTAGTTFTYTVAGSPSTPATGTILASKSLKLHGTTTGATVGQVGKVGKAYSFDGVGDDVDLGSNAALVAGTGNFSYGALALIGTNTSNAFLLASRTSASGQGYDIITANGSTAGNIAVRANGTGGSFESTSKLVTKSAWHFIVGVIDRTNNKLISYIDGVATDTGTDITTIGTINNAQNPFICKRGTASGQYSGVQHVFLINRALSANEMLKLARISGLA